MPVHERTSAVDGWVSLEVSPLLARDAQTTLAQAKDLHARAARRNLFIKIPGTAEGLPAIEEAIFAGVPINVTLLFSAEQYLAAAQAYLRGVERRIDAGLNPNVASVASVFISSWDVAVASKVPAPLVNTLGIAIGARAYSAYAKLIESPRWRRAFNAGARPQRLLFASTGTKDPKASDILYVKGLFAPLTINTVPEGTLKAFADHGEVGAEPRMAVTASACAQSFARLAWTSTRSPRSCRRRAPPHSLHHGTSCFPLSLPGAHRSKWRNERPDERHTHPTRWCSSGPRATSPTRRSSRRCRRWPSAASLDVPVIGVAKAGWTLDQLRARARTASRSTAASTAAAFDKLSALLALRRRRLQRSGDVRGARAGARRAREHPAHYLAIPPMLFGTGRRAAGAVRLRERRARRRREAVRPRPRVGAQTLNAHPARHVRRGATSSASTTTSASGPCTTCCSSASRMLSSRPFWNRKLRRERADHDGRELRRPGPRRLLRRDRRRSATWFRTTCSRC